MILVHRRILCCITCYLHPQSLNRNSMTQRHVSIPAPVIGTCANSNITQNIIFRGYCTVIYISIHRMTLMVLVTLGAATIGMGVSSRHGTYFLAPNLSLSYSLQHESCLSILLPVSSAWVLTRTLHQIFFFPGNSNFCILFTCPSLVSHFRQYHSEPQRTTLVPYRLA